MKYNFWERTTSHILNVNKVFRYLDREKAFYNYDNWSCDFDIDTRQDLLYRINTHDQSKFSSKEIIGYTYTTEFYGKKCGYVFTNDEKYEMDKAWEHHYKTNPHHPDFHDNINNMSIIDIIEMVCDWGAMSLEFKSSLMDYVNNKAFKQWKWDSLRKKLS